MVTKSRAGDGWSGLMALVWRVAMMAISTISISAGPGSTSQAAPQGVPAHQFAVYFDVQDAPTNNVEQSLAAVADWCRQNAISKIYIETYRDGAAEPAGNVQKAKQVFGNAGIEVAGGLATTGMGMASVLVQDNATTTNRTACYTDPETQRKLTAIVESAARTFDEIVLDDFLYTECECGLCQKALEQQRFVVGSETYAFVGDAWPDLRDELLLKISQELILATARSVNPDIRIMIKYPKWYEKFSLRGYDVVLQTKDFDGIWVGTETRDYNYPDPRWAGTPQYAGYFLMRWLSEIGGPKTRGGWYDWIASSPKTYVEQARQTILGGARATILYCYGGLQLNSGEDYKELRSHRTELLDVAAQVQMRSAVGVAAYKPVAALPVPDDMEVFGFIGMLGIPLAPCSQFPTNAPAAFFSTHALADSSFTEQFDRFVASGKPVLITASLRSQLPSFAQKTPGNVQVLPDISHDALLQTGQAELDAIRKPLLNSLNINLRAPSRVALYLFSDSSSVLENFNDTDVVVELNGAPVTVPARDWVLDFRRPKPPGGFGVIEGH